MKYLKELMTSLKFYEGVSDQSVIADGNGEKYNYIPAFRGNDYILLYTYNGRNIRVAMGKIEGAEVNCWWFSPKSGIRTFIGKFVNKGVIEFKPKAEVSDGNDFVLMILKA